MVISTVIVLEPSSNMLEACRTCLELIDVDYLPFYEIEADNVQLSTESCRYKLSSVIPEMALNITPKSMICAECHESLEALFEFKEKCLRTENIITRYFQVKPDVDMKNLDLKDVSAFKVSHTENNTNTKDVAFVAVKEELDESMTVVKYEVDDYSTENVEVAQQKNTVLGSSPDISEEEAVEASIGTVKEDVELSDPVISIVKFEVDDFSSKSVEVAKPYRCEMCDRSFVHKVNLTTHLRIHTGERPYVCTICDKGFVSSSELKKHMRSHTGEKPYRCEVCDRRFTRNTYLKYHLRTHTGERPYECEECQMKFTLHSSLIQHQIRHSGVKNFKCEHCDKSFNKFSVLKNHLLTHTGEKPYRCEVCNQRFTRKYLLADHMRKHTCERPYVCTVCGKDYCSNYKLKQHMETHPGEHPYRCETCQKGFILHSSLVAHQKRHSDVKSFECEYCKKCFVHKGHLRQHMRVHVKI